MQLRHHDFLLSTGMLNLAVSSGDCVNFTLGFRQDREMKVENGKITLTPKKMKTLTSHLRQWKQERRYQYKVCVIGPKFGWLP